VPNLKSIRNRIASVKSTQKITRAMKMVAGARLNRAQQRIVALRPFAVKTGQMLAEVTRAAAERAEQGGEPDHPLLARREENNVLLLVLTSDRGLCGAFNANINRTAERHWKELTSQGKQVKIAVIGRKGRDYMTRRKAPVMHVFSHVWEKLGREQAELVAKTVLLPFANGEVDSIYLIYNEFKSAVTQRVVVEPLFPLPKSQQEPADVPEPPTDTASQDFIFEPDKSAVLEQLVPTYVELSILRALYESMASFFGAQMTAMDAATKSAAEMIDRLTLFYNRARQAAITTELMEIIGGANALKE
jgi:F-type H+-transporting ATPase subunit gamma